MKDIKNIRNIPIAILVLLLIFVFISKNKPEKAFIPEINGVFEPKKPIQELIKNEKTQIIKWKTKEKEIFVEIENKINDSLVKNYINAKDSLDRLKLYIKSIEQKNFKSNFEDENVKIDVSGVVQGEIKSLETTYKIKEREVEIKPMSKIRMQSNLNIGNGLNMSGGIGFENKKNHIISIGYSNVAGNNYYSIGYSIPILRFK